ncbi:ABC transporter ATP-binding protein [Spirochaetota bacterium]
MIKVENITKRYGNTEALKGISFEIKQGEIIGLLGPNGAGKTTTMRILTGFMPATGGNAWIDNIDVHEDPIAVKRMTGYLPENPPLYHEMKVTDYLCFAAEIKGVPRDKIKSRISYVLEAAGLTDMRGRIIARLSKGYRQRVGIAMALVNDPKVLILDEPTIGLDPNQIAQIRSLIKGLAGTRTIILSTHILPEVSFTCERVIIIANGRIVAQDTQAGLTKLAHGDSKIIVRLTGRAKEAAELLRGIEQIEEVKSIGDMQIEVLAKNEESAKPEIAKALVAQSFSLLELRSESASLEKIFHTLTTEEGS